VAVVVTRRATSSAVFVCFRRERWPGHFPLCRHLASNLNRAATLPFRHRPPRLTLTQRLFITSLRPTRSATHLLSAAPEKYPRTRSRHSILRLHHPRRRSRRDTTASSFCQRGTRPLEGVAGSENVAVTARQRRSTSCRGRRPSRGNAPALERLLLLYRLPPRQRLLLPRRPHLLPRRHCPLDQMR